MTMNVTDIILEPTTKIARIFAVDCSAEREMYLERSMMDDGSEKEIEFFFDCSIEAEKKALYNWLTQQAICQRNRDAHGRARMRRLYTRDVARTPLYREDIEVLAGRTIDSYGIGKYRVGYDGLRAVDREAV